MHDVFMVTSEGSGGGHIVRTVYAADEDDARQTHQENYDEPIVEVHEAAQDNSPDNFPGGKFGRSGLRAARGDRRRGAGCQAGVPFWRHVRPYTTARIAEEARPEAAAGQQDRGDMGNALAAAFWAILFSLAIWCGIADVVVWLLGR